MKSSLSGDAGAVGIVVFGLVASLFGVMLVEWSVTSSSVAGSRGSEVLSLIGACGCRGMMNAG